MIESSPVWTPPQKFAVLIGEGPNNIQIPALVFSSMEKGLEACKKVLGEPKKRGTDYYWRLDDGDGEVNEEVIKQMYTSYYGGCGECYNARLTEIEEGKAFVGFNLD